MRTDNILAEFQIYLQSKKRDEGEILKEMWVVSQFEMINQVLKLFSLSF